MAHLPPLYIDSVGSGPDVVLLHGWGLHGGVFADLAARLASCYTVHRVDLPGHGHSAPLPPGSSLEHVVAQLQQAFPLPLQLVGWSLGGLIGQYWAAAAPQQIRSLALIASSPRFVAGPDWEHAQARADIEQVGAELGSAFAATLERFFALQTLGAPGARDTLRLLQEALLAHGQPQDLVSALNWLLDGDARPLAAQIRCPVTVLSGARDRLTPPGAAEWLAGNLEDAKLVSLARAAHAPFLSHPEELAAELLAHLEFSR